eukprot:TRINITY_DN1275_c0_g2_i1.p1 TRINITY_DN1275_c0_g2~~TRINITY_DN1275_c0_g2_i1.p1  ORF type:complete len:354 (-),score=102.40 TRINITY_DN1275_c0_g2_i1:37-1098(-)
MVNTTTRELENPEEQPMVKKAKAEEVEVAAPSTTTTESNAENNKAISKTNGLYYVTFYTSDIKKSVKFFTEVFGFKERKEEGGKEYEEWVELATPGQHSTQIGLRTLKEGVTPGTIEMSVLVANLEKFHAEIRDTKDLVVRSPPTRQFWGGYTADYALVGLEQEVLFKALEDFPFRASFDKKFYSPITDESTYLYYTSVLSSKVLQVADFFKTVFDFKEHGYPASEFWTQLKGPGTHSSYLAAGAFKPQYKHESYKQGTVQLEFVVPDVEKFHEKITQNKDVIVVSPPEKTAWGSASAAYIFDGLHIGVAQNCEIIKNSLEKEVPEVETETPSLPSTKVDEVEKKEIVGDEEK